MHDRGGCGTADAESVTVASTRHTLTDLRPATAYTVRVMARNQEGAAAVASHTASTQDAAPGRVRGGGGRPGLWLRAVVPACVSLRRCAPR